MSTTYPYQLPPKCHEGNVPIFSIEGGTLYAGGWSRDAWPYLEDAVIDLTGRENPPKIIEARRGKSVWRNALSATKDIRYGPWLSLPIPDLGVPELGAEFWRSLKLDIGWILRSGTNLLVACEGGHGRTGLVVSILAHLFAKDSTKLALDLAEFDGCPITWLRNRYCESAVDTEEQARYIYEMLDLGEPPEEIMLGPYCGGAWYYEDGHLTEATTVVGAEPLGRTWFPSDGGNT